jgi:importin subunit beta-1
VFIYDYTDKAAEEKIRQLEAKNVVGLLQGLTAVLLAEGVSPVARQVAGLVIKNALYAKEEALLTFKQQRWESLDAGSRNSIKEPLMLAMRNHEAVVSHTAAQACAEIAAMELPHNQWPEFLQMLLENVRDAKYPDNVKAASLECIGYCCERINFLGKDVNEQQTDGMLNVIIDGINSNRPNEVRLAAATALRNSLGFAEKNMDRPAECKAIMDALMDSTRSPAPKIRMMAYEGIVQVAVLYYSKLSEFMSALYQLTTNTINTDNDENVVKSAIEFWTSLCEVEQDLIDDEAMYRSRGEQPAMPCMNYVNSALQHLVPILCGTLTKQQEDLDEDEFTVHMAGQLCLTNVSQTVEDHVVPVLSPFIQQNISSQDWRHRDAAVMAFISMLEGPSQQSIGAYVQQSISGLLVMLNDPNEVVRDSTAHCIARICLLHFACIPSELYDQLFQALDAKCKEGSPKVASQAASALFNVAQAFRGKEEEPTNMLSKYLQVLLTSLLQCADRPDGDESNLRVASMEAISELISVSADDMKLLLAQALPEFITRFEATFQMDNLTPEDKNRRDQVQGLLCAVLQSLYRKLDRATVGPHTDRAMMVLLKALQNNSNCQEECFSAISAVADAVEAEFGKYMEALAPMLVGGLRNFSAYQVCIVAVGTVGDICRNIEGQMQPFCDQVMTALAECLKDETIHRSVKPPVLSCFGDIAMAIGAGYQPYLNFSMMMLMQAGQMQVNTDDEDLIDYMNLLRESVLEAFVGIVQGLRDGNLLQEFAQYVHPILQFLQLLSDDPNRDDFVLGKAVGLLGDIAMTMPAVMPQLKQDLNQTFVAKLLADAQASGDQSMMETAAWATGVLNQAVYAA